MVSTVLGGTSYRIKMRNTYNSVDTRLHPELDAIPSEVTIVGTTERVIDAEEGMIERTYDIRLEPNDTYVVGRLRRAGTEPTTVVAGLDNITTRRLHGRDSDQLAWTQVILDGGQNDERLAEILDPDRPGLLCAGYRLVNWIDPGTGVTYEVGLVRERPWEDSLAMVSRLERICHMFPVRNSPNSRVISTLFRVAPVRPRWNQWGITVEGLRDQVYLFRQNPHRMSRHRTLQ